MPVGTIQGGVLHCGIIVFFKKTEIFLVFEFGFFLIF
jgi:hypothetical protein